jgi:hypothetical protein
VERNPLKAIIKRRMGIYFFTRRTSTSNGAIISHFKRIMKLRKVLPFRFLKKAGQKGQSIVEFVLLLAVMASITYMFVHFMNRNLTRYWEHAANLVVNDAPGIKTLTMP